MLCLPQEGDSPTEENISQRKLAEFAFIEQTLESMNRDEAP
jgi:hypothetical protein